VARKAKAGYRVDLKLCAESGGVWIPHTSKNDLVTLDFAVSIYQSLTRQGAGARVVEMPSGKIIEECQERKTS
jgi:hypothetical protein